MKRFLDYARNDIKAVVISTKRSAWRDLEPCKKKKFISFKAA